MEAEMGEPIAGLGPLAARAAAAIRAVHSPGVQPAELEQARAVHEELRRDPVGALRAALGLVAESQPEVQHFGFQLLLSALRARSPSPTAEARAEARAWLLGRVASGAWDGPSAGALSPPPAYVRTKCAEAVAELARLDWPERWPELRPALLAAARGPGACSAALALGSWCQLADLLAEDSKDLTPERRKELKEALTALVAHMDQKLPGQPAQAPELALCLQEALQRHGAHAHVVQEALGLCRALAHAVPGKLLLASGFDKIVRVGLDLPDLRGLAVAALAGWVDNLCPKGKNAPMPGGHDLARLTAMLGQLARRCVFDGDQGSYVFHRQVAELLSDLCASSAAGLYSLMRTPELGDLWGALLHLLRYPSAAVQADALSGMVQLARAQSAAIVGKDGWDGSDSPPRPPLEQLASLLFVHSLRAELLVAERDLEPDRSHWRLECLGTPSTSETLPTFQCWVELLSRTRGFDLCDRDADAEERKQVYGTLKTRAADLLGEVSRSGTVKGVNEGYGALCRLASSIAARALGGARASAAEFEAAVSLVERTGTAALRAAEKQSKEVLDGVLQPSLEFLKQVTAPAATFHCTLEVKRLEFLSHWAPFYRHFSEDVLGQVLQRLIAVVENPPADKDSISLQRRALDTLVSLGKHGVLRPQQLEALNTEFQRIAPKLTPNSQGKLTEALSAAIAACGELQPARRAELVSGIMEQPTARWIAAELVQQGGSGALQATVAAAAAAAAQAAATGQDAPVEQILRPLKDVWVLAGIFVGVVTKTSPDRGQDARVATPGENPFGTSCGHPAAKVVKAWAPGVFALGSALASLGPAGGPSEALAAALGPLSDNEHISITGRKPEERESAPSPSVPLDAPGLVAVRNIVWDLRSMFAKAMHACLMCEEVWTLPQTTGWIRSVAEVLPSLRPHTAELLLKEIFHPLIRVDLNPTTSPDRVPEPLREAFCREVLPPLISAITKCIRAYWSKGASDALLMPSAFEEAFAAAVVSFSRSAALLLGALAGTSAPAGTARVAIPALCDPERRLFRGLAGEGAPQQAPLPQSSNKRRKKNNSTRNRFAALADEDAQAAPGGRAAAAPARCDGVAEEHDAPQGLVPHVFCDRGLRDAVRVALARLLAVPEKETVTRALIALADWQAQLWNHIARGRELGATAGASASLPEAGELLHAASDALRPLPSEVLQPVLSLVARPPAVGADARQGSQEVESSGALASIVQQPWKAFTSSNKQNGKLMPSGLVIEAHQAAATTLRILTRYFKIQCRRLNVKIALDQLYLSPVLFEASKVYRNLPNTTEDDVTKLIEVFLQEGASLESQRLLVRALLHEASPAFSADREGA